MTEKFTREMRNTLIAMVRNCECSALPQTISALKKRNFLTEEGTLTPQGRQTAILFLPLREQCSALNIEYIEKFVPRFAGRPETEALRQLNADGYIGSYCEGGAVLLLIRAAALDLLSKINTFQDRKDACTRFTEAQLTIHKNHGQEIITAIRQSTTSRVIDCFTEIYESGMVRECYPGLNKQIIEGLYETIGKDRLAEIAAAMLEDPYRYRSGWPDLTLTNGSEMFWAEVKTTDKLHENQISTLTRMIPLLPGKIGVIQLKTSTSTINRGTSV